jgi:pseudolysin
MKKLLIKFSLLPVTLLVLPVFAAEKVNLMREPFAILSGLSANQSNISVAEIRRSTDARKTLHVRVQEMYSGHRVFGADAVVHIPHGAQNLNHPMNGIFYKNLKADLANTPAKVFSKTQAQLAEQWAVNDYQRKIGAKIAVEEQESELLVYVDREDKAHWAYKITFFVPTTKPARPVYLLDAVNFHVYKTWNDIQSNSAALGGGYGGNARHLGLSMLIYDGGSGHLPALNISRTPGTHLCRLQNKNVNVKDKRSGSTLSYNCTATDPNHNNVYWNPVLDAAHGGFSPGNDALFGGDVVAQMYLNWYHVPVLSNEDGTPMVLKMYVHSVADGDNAHWDIKKSAAFFGDGKDICYPLTSLGVIAHEASHGFTQQHSSLNYEGQSGGLNESFSDMASQTVEAYVYGRNSWQIGGEVMKMRNAAMRYMKQPSKNCYGKIPGNECAIDDASQYVDDMDPHHSSGVYNQFFYLLSTSPGWNIQTAFGLMVEANSHYWTSESTYNSAACGVLQAAADLHLDPAAIKAAFAQVKVDDTDGGQCAVSG